MTRRRTFFEAWRCVLTPTLTWSSPVRTALIILGGFVLWGVCLLLAKMLGGSRPSLMTVATAAFAVVWLCVAAWNMWMGVARAGYSVSEELPIFFVIFLVPVVVAVIVKWRFL